MRFLLILFVTTLSWMVAFGQQIPFQGKLLENGTAVTGQRTFSFSINNNGVNWSETHNNVVVTNGLYALVLGQNIALPSTLFAAQNSRPLAIQVNGQSLPTTTLYAPFESDPSVPAHLKDGVSWDEVTAKPDLTPELAIDGNNLSIVGSNTVELPTTDDTPTDVFTVGSEGMLTICALEQLSTNGVVSLNTMWQSFSIADEGQLQNIQVNLANIAGSNIRLRIYQGVGISTQAIYARDYAAGNFGSSLGLKSFDIASFDNINLEESTTYTFYIEGLQDVLSFRQSSDNPYLFGRMNTDSNTDAVFKINLQQPSNFTFEVTPAKTTINTPLTVNDRIEDKTGFIMPVGAIISYGASTPPKGWLLCDGRAVSKVFYPDLFEVIGNIWGFGNFWEVGHSATFSLPDLRGQFLRGVSGTTNRDPDKDTRHSFYLGNRGNNVGSYQSDATALPNTSFTVEDHTHTIPRVIKYEDERGNPAPPPDSIGLSVIGWPIFGTYINSISTGNAVTDSPNLRVNDGGDNETRPRNANVNFIIKY